MQLILFVRIFANAPVQKEIKYKPKHCSESLWRQACVLRIC